VDVKKFFKVIDVKECIVYLYICVVKRYKNQSSL